MLKGGCSYSINMDPITILSAVGAVVKTCYWAGNAIHDLAESFNSTNRVLASIAAECKITSTLLKRVQDVLRDRPEAFVRSGHDLELLDTFDTAVGGIRRVIHDLAKEVAKISRAKAGVKRGAQFVWNESELTSLRDDMRGQRSLIDSVIIGIQT